jgi:hypothetical protein
VPLDALYCTEVLEFRGLSEHVHCTAEHPFGAKGGMHSKLGQTVARCDLPQTPYARARSAK